MMNIRINKFFVACTLIMCSLFSIAQAPGYMGKRFSAGYGIYASPGFVGTKGLTYVNVLHEGFIEFAAKKKFSVGLSARFYNGLVNNDRYYMRGDVFVNNTMISYNGQPSGAVNLKGRNFMLYGKFFKKNYLAPWGKYFILGATLNTFTASYDPDQMYIISTDYYSKTTYYSDFGPEKQSYMKFDVMFGNGRSRIIADRVVLDYGYNINVWGATSLLLDALEISEVNHKASEYIKKTGSVRIREINRFNLFFKVAYLF